MNQRNKRTLLLVIDAQKDFMDIPGAALPVPGAVSDTERLVALIDRVNPAGIFSSLDTHYTLDIAHSAWWNDAEGNPVKPFTLILADDIKNGKYVARIDPKRSLAYVEALEANGEFNHFIWPDHCIQGSEGHALLPIYMKALNRWEEKNLRWVNFITKGVNPFTEHFGIFRANIPVSDDAANTDVNQGLFQAMNTYDEVLLAGQARTHCVANSLRQMISIAPQLASKLIVLNDCMSNVTGLPNDFYTMVDGIYNDACSKGVRMALSTDII